MAISSTGTVIPDTKMEQFMSNFRKEDIYEFLLRDFQKRFSKDSNKPFDTWVRERLTEVLKSER